MLSQEECLDILGVSAQDSHVIIKEKYRQLVRKWHPDLFPNGHELKQKAEEMIKLINIAYEILLKVQSSKNNNSSTQVNTEVKVSSYQTGTVGFYELGCQYAQKKQYQEAISNFSAAIRLNPSYFEAYRHRGFIYSILGLERCAESDLQKAKKLEQQGKAKKNYTQTQSQKSRSQARTRQKATTDEHLCVEWICEHQFKSHHQTITQATLAHNQRFLACGTSNGVVEIWNIKTQKCFHTIHSSNDAIVALDWSFDNEFLAIGYQSNIIEIWNLPNNSLFKKITINYTLKKVIFTKQKNLIFIGELDGSISALDLVRKNTVMAQFEGTQTLSDMVCDPTGSMIFAAFESGSISIYQARTGEILKKLPATAPNVSTLEVGQNRIFITHEAGVMAIRNFNGEPEAEWKLLDQPITSLALNHDATLIATVTQNSQVNLWSCQSGASMGYFSDLETGLIKIFYIKQENYWLTISEKGTIQAWKPNT